jgi:hypothetical protein
MSPAKGGKEATIRECLGAPRKQEGRHPLWGRHLPLTPQRSTKGALLPLDQMRDSTYRTASCTKRSGFAQQNDGHGSDAFVSSPKSGIAVTTNRVAITRPVHTRTVAL